MNSYHARLHERTVFTAKEYLKREAELVSLLQEIDRGKTYRHFAMPSLYAYSTQLLGLSESVAYALINVARKAVQVPELKAALEEKKITLSKARRIAPILNQKNKAEWIEKAATLPQNKLEFELAKSFPERPSPTRTFAKSETLSRLEIDLSRETMQKLKRAQDVLAQKKQTHVDLAQALDLVLHEFLTRFDPIEKAKRAQNRTKPVELVLKPVHQKKQKTDLQTPNSKTEDSKPILNPRRAPIPATLKHQLTLRDKAQCTHLQNGKRCEERRWLHLHHLVPVTDGGSNRLANLTTLCSGHHRVSHLASGL